MSGSAYLLTNASKRLRERLEGARATVHMSYDKHNGYIEGLLCAIRDLEDQASAERTRALAAAREAQLGEKS